MKIFLISIGLISLVVAYLAFSGPVPSPIKPTLSPTPIISLSIAPPLQSIDFNHNGKTYRIAWLAIRDLTSLSLIPNFTQKRTAQSLIDTKECREMVSGGFYTTDDEPTGLFISQGTTIRKAIPNALLNGYFVINEDSVVSILQSPPDGSVRIALQTGPMLIQHGIPLNLSIRDDEFARRIGVGMTTKSNVIFWAIYDPDNTGSGPKLSEVPQILKKFISLSGVNLLDAINLDGGSASAFIRDDFSLQELTNVGSFFCIR